VSVLYYDTITNIVQGHSVGARNNVSRKYKGHTNRVIYRYTTIPNLNNKTLPTYFEDLVCEVSIMPRWEKYQSELGENSNVINCWAL